MNQFPNRQRRTLILSFFALLSGYLLIAGLSVERTDSKAVRKSVANWHRARASVRPGNLVSRPSTLAQINLGGIKNGGFGAALLTSAVTNKLRVPSAYRPLDEINDEMTTLKSRFPNLVHRQKVGVTTALGQPIWGIKVSDNASQREDEPRILFVGVHHAREPIGSKICLEIATQLCEGYRRNEQITKWVEGTEVWFIPVVNPDGYQYILENDLSFPWWRKNLRDNDGDGVFNPLYDGVDLNRNYDFNWDEGGDGKPSSWFFRGDVPFSESETQAIMNLALRENFVIGISYHSYGESILFPWGNFKRPPDLELIVEIASEMASRITKESGRGKYSILPLNGRVGQSSIWMYGQLRVIDYIVEVGTEYFPAEENIPFILQEHIKGAFYLFDRLFETGIKGHVYDSLSKRPLAAEIEIEELASPYVRPRQTDQQFGSFHRLLKPGRFSLQVTSHGYHPKVIKNIRIEKGELIDLEIELDRSPEYYSNGTTKK